MTLVQLEFLRLLDGGIVHVDDDLADYIHSLFGWAMSGTEYVRQIVGRRILALPVSFVCAEAWNGALATQDELTKTCMIATYESLC